MDLAAVLAEVGPRLRRLRAERDLSLGALAELTGISKSTLSRLESGRRRPSLELLLPIAHAYRIPLDELVGHPEPGDPRVHLIPHSAHGQTLVPLTRAPGPIQAFKIVIPPTSDDPDLKTHEGYEWIYVLAGRLRVIIGDHDLLLTPGEAAEFDTRLPHWFGTAGPDPVELLSLFGRQGERIHLRARPKRAVL